MQTATASKAAPSTATPPTQAKEKRTRQGDPLGKLWPKILETIIKPHIIAASTPSPKSMADFHKRFCEVSGSQPSLPRFKEWAEKCGFTMERRVTLTRTGDDGPQDSIGKPASSGANTEGSAFATPSQR